MEDSEPTNEPESETTPRKISHTGADNSTHLFSVFEHPNGAGPTQTSCRHDSGQYSPNSHRS